MAVLERLDARGPGRGVLTILRSGEYVSSSGGRVDVRDALDACRDATIEFPPDEDAPLPPARIAETVITAENATVLGVGRRMVRTGSVAALNFASATHPGGGFLKGASGQEESIARSSGLFYALEGRRMYTFHRDRLDARHSDWIIYSPDVPVFRTDAGEMLDEPWMLTILTCAAVNGAALARYAPERLSEVPAVMAARTSRVLSVAAGQGVRRFILGAWGCGAFTLEPRMMAGIFRDALTGPFRGVFDEIVFAIADGSLEQRVLRPFRQAFRA